MYFVLFSSFLSYVWPKQEEGGRQQPLTARGCGGACVTWSTFAVKPTQKLTDCSESLSEVTPPTHLHLSEFLCDVIGNLTRSSSRATSSSRQGAC